jgi:hypothetical protein
VLKILPTTMNWSFGTAGSPVLTVVTEYVSEGFYCRHNSDLWDKPLFMG